MKHRLIALCALLALTGALAAPASALLLTQDDEISVSAFTKRVAPGDTAAFSPGDFLVSGGAEARLDAIVLTSLPEAGAGLLKLGDEELAVGDWISMAAVEGMRFYPLFAPVVDSASFTFTPVFNDGVAGREATVSLYLTAEENRAPTAENLELCTYKNVSAKGQFAASDPEGDALTFQLVDKPARGQVEISEDGSGSFIYTPYENKTGKDSFVYVAIDSAGNRSEEAVVKVTISKAKTKVTYADLDGRCAKAAIRLAEEGVLVGTCMDGSYYFQPDLPVTRDQFVTMAMSAAGLRALDGVELTGFADDDAIPMWAKGYVSCALMSGIIRGSADESGSICFNSGAAITGAEAAAVVDRLLNMDDVAVESGGFAASVPAWAVQSAANMRAAGVLTGGEAMTRSLTRLEAAEIVCAMLEYRDRQRTGWFG